MLTKVNALGGGGCTRYPVSDQLHEATEGSSMALAAVLAR